MFVKIIFYYLIDSLISQAFVEGLLQSKSSESESESELYQLINDYLILFNNDRSNNCTEVFKYYSASLGINQSSGYGKTFKTINTI